MAQYKVPQDVEAEDKLLGPFTFRQFIYLMIGAACCAGVWGALQIFAPLAIIPIPFAIFFIVLALPLKKDQPMETYLAAIVSFHMKPNKRVWTAGQRESTILITAPKQKEASRTRDITEDEASHRLSFLADIVDTEGAAIRGTSLSQNPSIKDEYVAEASQVSDFMEANNEIIDRMIEKEKAERKAELVSQMRNAVQLTNELDHPQPAAQEAAPAQPAAPAQATTEPEAQPVAQPAPQPAAQPAPQPVAQAAPQPAPQPIVARPAQATHQGFTQPVAQPVVQAAPQPVAQPVAQPAARPQTQYVHVNPFENLKPNDESGVVVGLRTPEVAQRLTDLANNSDYSIQTIAAEANRIQSQAIYSPEEGNK